MVVQSERSSCGAVASVAATWDGGSAIHKKNKRECKGHHPMLPWWWHPWSKEKQEGKDLQGMAVMVGHDQWC